MFSLQCKVSNKGCYYFYYFIIDQIEGVPSICPLWVCILLFKTVNVYLIYSESNLFTTVQIAAVLLARYS